MRFKHKNILHIDGLPSLVPLERRGAIKDSHFATPSSTDIPAEPSPLGQSGSS